MTKETYEKITGPLRQEPKLAGWIHKINQAITGSMYLAYPLLVLYHLWRRDPIATEAIIVPLDGFIILSVFRAMINRPRPYETFEIPPVVPKNTRGRSFPSRHVFSATIIALTFVCCSPWPAAGWILLGLCLILAVVRVLLGIHYPTDVAAGFLAAVLCAFVGYGLYF